LPSGCYPLDSYYKDSELARRLKEAKEKVEEAVSITPPSAALKANPPLSGDEGVQSGLDE
jgi:hypothetical protein